jgi:predicted nucleotidyltransferase
MSASQIEFYGGYPVYSDTGVDLTMLRENLRRSVEQRWEENQRMVALAVAFRSAGLGVPAQETPMFDGTNLIRQLSTGCVEFVVIGGLAMIARGVTSMTKDLDVCYNRATANLSALAAALAPLHPYPRGAPPGLPFKLDVPTLHAGLNFTLVTDHGDLDLLGEVSGVGRYEQVLAQSDELDVFGLKVRVLSLEGLIAAKKAAGRAKDQAHLLELEELKKLRDSQG